jgi:hypothetical protein
VVSGQWSVVSGQWSVVNGQWSMVNGQWSMVNGQLNNAKHSMQIKKSLCDLVCSRYRGETDH